MTESPHLIIFVIMHIIKYILPALTILLILVSQFCYEIYKPILLCYFIVNRVQTVHIIHPHLYVIIDQTETVKPTFIEPLGLSVTRWSSIHYFDLQFFKLWPLSIRIPLHLFLHFCFPRINSIQIDDLFNTSISIFDTIFLAIHLYLHFLKHQSFLDIFQSKLSDIPSAAFIIQIHHFLNHIKIAYHFILLTAEIFGP